MYNLTMDDQLAAEITLEVVHDCVPFVTTQGIQIVEGDVDCGEWPGGLAAIMSAAAVNGYRMPASLAARVRPVIDFLSEAPIIHTFVKKQFDKVV